MIPIMENLIVGSLVVLICFGIQITRTSKKKEKRLSYNHNQRVSNLNLIFDRCKKEFLNLNVEKINDQITISEYPKLKSKAITLVFITLNPQKAKSISRSGDFVVARYPYPPSKEDMRKDLARVINQY